MRGGDADDPSMIVIFEAMLMLVTTKRLVLRMLKSRRILQKLKMLRSLRILRILRMLKTRVRGSKLRVRFGVDVRGET